MSDDVTDAAAAYDTAYEMSWARHRRRCLDVDCVCREAAV